MLGLDDEWAVVAGYGPIPATSVPPQVGLVPIPIALELYVGEDYGLAG